MEASPIPTYVSTATPAHLSELVSLYERATRSLEIDGIHQWDEQYPDIDTIKNDIASGTAYVCIIDKQIASVFTVNKECDPEYADGEWQYPKSSFAVIHRLCVDPACQKEGIGIRTMLAAESLIQDMNFECVRLDAFSQNPAALRLYDKLCYSEVGIFSNRVGSFILFEKKL